MTYEIIAGPIRLMIGLPDQRVQFSIVSASASGKLKHSRVDEELQLDDWGLISLSVKLLNHSTTAMHCPHLYLEGLEIPKGRRAWGSSAQLLRQTLLRQKGRYGNPPLDNRDRLFKKESITLGDSTLWYAEGEERPWRLTKCNCSLRTLLEFAAIVLSDKFTELFDKRVWVPWLVLTPPSKFQGKYLVSETLVKPVAGWTPPPPKEEVPPQTIGIAMFAEAKDEPESGSSEEREFCEELPSSPEDSLNVVSLLYLPDGGSSDLGIGLVKEGEQYRLATITEEYFEDAATRYMGSTSTKVTFPRFSDLVEFFVSVVLGPEFSDYVVPVFPENYQRFHDWLPGINSKPTRGQKEAWEAIQKSVRKASLHKERGDGAAASLPLLPRVGTICLRDQPPYGFSFSTGALEDNPCWTREELAKMALLVLSDPLNNRRADTYGSVLTEGVEIWRGLSPEAGLDEVLPLKTTPPESASLNVEVSPSSDAESVEPSSVEGTPQLRIDSSETSPVAQRTLLVPVSTGERISEDSWDSLQDPNELFAKHLATIKADFHNLYGKLSTQ